MRRPQAAGGPSPVKVAATSKRTRAAGGRKAKAVLERTPVQGWKTSDEDEIALRRWRGRTEILDVAAQNREPGFYGTYRARSSSGGHYEVEIRSLDRTLNSCGCIDHRVNGLGTCKHVEGVLAALQRGKARAFRAAAASGSPKVEVFLDRSAGATPRILWPSEVEAAALAPACAWLKPWLDNEATLSTAPDKLEVLLASWPNAPAAVKAVPPVTTHSLRVRR